MLRAGKPRCHLNSIPDFFFFSLILEQLFNYCVTQFPHNKMASLLFVSLKISYDAALEPGTGLSLSSCAHPSGCNY